MSKLGLAQKRLPVLAQRQGGAERGVREISPPERPWGGASIPVPTDAGLSPHVLLAALLGAVLPDADVPLPDQVDLDGWPVASREFTLRPAGTD